MPAQQDPVMEAIEAAYPGIPLEELKDRCVHDPEFLIAASRCIVDEMG